MYRSTIMLAGVLAVTFPHAGFALDCLAYLAADEALKTAFDERDRVLHEAAAPLREIEAEIEAETKRAIEAARVANDEELQAAEIENVAALQAADEAYRNAQRAGGPDPEMFRQTMLDLDQAWLKAMDKGDKAGMRAAQDAKAEASATFRAADEESRAASRRHVEATHAAERTFLARSRGAHEAFDRTVEAVEAGEAAERGRLQAAAEAAEESESVQAARAAFAAARAGAENAYIATYQNPAPNLTRETEGYSHAVVLKMAISERQLCPE